jgi:hypothetical protein
LVLPDGRRLVLTFAQTLWLKQARDPQEWDAERLEALYHRPLPDLAEPHDYFQEMYRKHRGKA